MHSRDPNNYYVLLGLNPYQRHTYEMSDLKAAYNKSALQYHPDRNKHDPETAAEKFKAVSEAYSILLDPETREDYDDDLNIENKDAFSRMREARQRQAMLRNQRVSEAKQRQYERELKERPQKEAELAEKENEKKEYEQRKRRMEILDAKLEEERDFWAQEDHLIEQKYISKLHFFIKILVGLYISIKLLPRMFIEAFFGLFLLPLLIIFDTEQTLGHLIPGGNPKKSYHPIVRGIIILLTLALLPLTMLLGAFVLPYRYFNKNEKTAASKAYFDYMWYLRYYLNDKLPETIFVVAFVTIPVALFIAFPPAGLLSLLGTGGTIAAYLGLEAASKSILVAILSSIVAVATAVINTIVDKIQDSLPKKPFGTNARFKAYQTLRACKKAAENTRLLITYLGDDRSKSASYSPSDASDEAKVTQSQSSIKPSSYDSAVLSAIAENENSKTKLYHQPNSQSYFNFWFAPTALANGNIDDKQNSKALIVKKH